MATMTLRAHPRSVPRIAASGEELFQLAVIEHAVRGEVLGERMGRLLEPLIDRGHQTPPTARVANTVSGQMSPPKVDCFQRPTRLPPVGRMHEQRTRPIRSLRGGRASAVLSSRCSNLDTLTTTRLCRALPGRFESAQGGSAKANVHKSVHKRHENGPRGHTLGPFPLVAGTGFEPATSGL